VLELCDAEGAGSASASASAPAEMLAAASAELPMRVNWCMPSWTQRGRSLFVDRVSLSSGSGEEVSDHDMGRRGFGVVGFGGQWSAFVSVTTCTHPPA